jgi:head-tail adaptor
MTSRLVHPRMLERLERDFFPQDCRIEQPSGETDEYGQASADDDESLWTAVPGMEIIPCRVAPASGGKRRTTQTTAMNETHIIILAGRYEVTAKMRAVVDGQAYDVLLPGHDAEGAMTRLSVQAVTP